jgi:predicted deacylase
MNPKRYEEIPVTTLASGYRLALPVHRIEGAESGPTLGMIALIHGDEPLPNVVLREVYAQLDPAALTGNVLIMPVANPLAYEALTRNTPQDMTNMNRVFPGKEAGWLTEQIAYVITTQFVPQLDYLVDFHSGGTFPTVDYVYLSKLEPAFSFAFGSDILYKGPGYEGTLSSVTEGQEIPTVVVELGGGGLMDDAYITRGIEGSFNVLKYLGMIEGEPQVPTQQTVVKEMAVIRPRAGGVLYPGVKLDQLGDVVARGTILGRVINPYTFEELEVIEAPFARNLMILLRGSITRVNPGDYAYMVANADVD